MEKRAFGRTGLSLSILGFGCGAVGGLMVRGSHADQDTAIGKALDAGINYFDTAVQYGDGESERNLGRIMKARKPGDAVIGTKVRVPSARAHEIEAVVTESLDASLQRLQRERVDIFHLHNPITLTGGNETLSVTQVRDSVLPAFEKLRQAGKTRFIGITAVGDTAAVRQVIDLGAFNSAQVSYNMLNPSAAEALPPGYPAQDYGRLFDHTRQAGVGVVGIRVLAGGALTGTADRHPTASPPPPPIGSAHAYETDLRRGMRLMPLVTEGYADSLAEAATRFAIGHPAMGTILVGMATIAEFEASLAAVRKGPLPAEALQRLAALRTGFVGEAR
ncbi:aldo/keto reductase [Rhodopila sp.]|uniref:aldo/keto reductase n=1 Tax=Rhodopila sp. TaxID=2480087 RepID=UPI002C28AD39|nr:aldo/keto reductase [Rhodopila sp.]HVZ07819.1 aldo/keto reductase [Rhodopila sp.]